jgi:1-acyl-sn-glycerol-3-phosphate acyltransferase
VKKVLGFFGLMWKLYVAIIFCFFAITMYPLFLIVLCRSSWKKYSFKLFIFWSWMMRIFCFYPVRKIGNSKLPDGPYVIIANHASYLDIFLMYSILPKHPFLFLGKAEILSYPIIGTYFRNLNIPVFRKAKNKAGKALIMAENAVKEGWSIAIFPEGGIPSENCPKMIPFKTGAFKLAKSLEIPIVCMTFTNNYFLFSDPTEILGPARPGISEVHIHPIIDKEKVSALSMNELSDFAFNLIHEPLVNKYPELYQNN